MKARIGKANTCDAFVASWKEGEGDWVKFVDALRYVDELRQQAKWDAEKCKY